MKLIIALLLCLTFFSCTNQKKKEETSLLKEKQNNEFIKKDSCDNNVLIPNEYIEEFNKALIINTEWISYHKSKISDLSAEKFEIIRKWTEKELITGTIYGDFDKEFNKNHIEFLINSPDNSQYIDLDSYTREFELNEKNQLIWIGDEVDQEINWVNRKNNEIKRIAFCGATSSVEDAKWLNNSTVGLYGINDNNLCITIIDLKNQDYKLFCHPETLQHESKFMQEVRLKKVMLE